jgi:hypothetical protein
VSAERLETACREFLAAFDATRTHETVCMQTLAIGSMRDALAAHAAEQVAQEPSAECWREAIGEWGRDPCAGGIELETNLDWIEQRARELATAPEAPHDNG